MDEIAADVDDLLRTKFEYSTTTSVPYDNDPGLSYEGGKTKWGKIIDTCVLYVDIRGSVNLNKDYPQVTISRLYTAFVKSVIKAGRLHGGHTRNIIGDRVMIVFDTKDCYTNAVSCAVSINHIADKVINEKFKGLYFKCGIGIDYGTMKVIKVGVPRRGNANAANRGLVWAGKPANMASRLTDLGNKTITETYYDVTIKPYTQFGSRSLWDYVNLDPYPAGLSRPAPNSFGSPGSMQPEYLDGKTVSMSEAEFLRKIKMDKGQLYSDKDFVVHFEKKTRNSTYPPILITERVLTGFKAEGLRSDLYKAGYWRDEFTVKDVDSRVFGQHFTWNL
ncbi:Adenylate and Guanylate cyclase catalytic domain-containing protein [Chitinophaga sp. CF418]|nr:Adenylate and Guanylate cyclase catalytic domain-containing protein [Chitinophaga sp. CF418]